MNNNEFERKIINDMSLNLIDEHEGRQILRLLSYFEGVSLYQYNEEIQLNEFLPSLADDELQYLIDAIDYKLFRINALGQKESIGDFEALNKICDFHGVLIQI